MLLGTAPLGTGLFGPAFVALSVDWAVPVGTNVILVKFSEPVIQGNPLDPTDALNPDNYAITPDDSSLVTPYVAYVLSSDDDEVEVWLSRGMEADEDYTFGIQGDITAETGALLAATPIEFTITGLKKAVSSTRGQRGKDLALPMTNQDEGLNLGIYSVDQSGDYALSSRISNFRKRIIRRIVTAKGSMVHAPDYGVGLKQYKSVNLTEEAQLSIATDIKRQVMQEPETVAVKTTFVQDAATGVTTVKVQAQHTSGNTVDAEFHINEQ